MSSVFVISVELGGAVLLAGILYALARLMLWEFARHSQQSVACHEPSADQPQRLLPARKARS